MSWALVVFSWCLYPQCYLNKNKRKVMLGRDREKDGKGEKKKDLSDGCNWPVILRAYYNLQPLYIVVVIFNFQIRRRVLKKFWMCVCVCSCGFYFIKAVLSQQSYWRGPYWRGFYANQDSCVNCCVSSSVMSDPWQSHGPKPSRLLCLWNSPGMNTEVGGHFLLQGIFSTQGLNPGLLHLLY